MANKVKLIAGMLGTVDGQLCTVDGVNGGWASITDASGKLRKVRITAISVVAQADEQAAYEAAGAGDDAVNRAKINAAAIKFPGIQTQTRSNTMATTKKVRKARAPRVGGSSAVRKIGKSEFRNIAAYQRSKTAAGNVTLDNGDDVSTKLRGMDLSEVYEFASKKLDLSVRSLKDRYAKLNPGQARMCLGNRLRGLMNKKAKAAAKAE